ncbi:MAG: DnaD domain protein [Clostridia bacterium]|nr:DnaD domain protein [Clostridia bacterium]
MPMFGFDDQYPMFDVTPVDNQFILEYLPTASGDAVRVYLYGLMQCYHPQTTMTIDQMARELHLSEDEILMAYRHWERKGLVRRIADHPPVFRYVSVKQTTFMGGAAPVDEEYDAFASALYAVFGNDRRLHGKEISQCYEWVEELHLPADVVICLMQHMVAVHGKGVSIKTIEKRALQLVEEKVATVEDAQIILQQDRTVREACKAVIKRMGKRRNPSEDELEYCRKWLQDWHFSQQDVLDACAELIKGDPNFKYLNAILERLYTQRKATGVNRRVEEAIAAEQGAIAPLKALLNVMKLRGVTINEGTIAVYEDMRALYPDAIILMAGQECARHGLALDDVMTTLQNWKRNGLQSVDDVRAYMKRINDQNDFLKTLYEIIGVEAKPNAADRRLIQRWLEEWCFDMGFVAQCAAWCIGKDKPMGYLDKLLEIYHGKGIRTLEAAQQERETFAQSRGTNAVVRQPVRGPKIVGEQQYTQREYTNTDDAIDAMMRKWQEENGNA